MAGIESFVRNAGASAAVRSRPESLHDRVVDLAERFQVPLDYPAAALIAMLAGATGRRALIRPKQHDDWVAYPNLWGGIVGRSGVMKTPLLNAVFGPLRRRQALALAIYERQEQLSPVRYLSARHRRCELRYSQEYSKTFNH